MLKHPRLVTAPGEAGTEKRRERNRAGEGERI
jgi:hypothetical protein